MLTSYRVQLLTIILVILTLLTLACGEKGQGIRETAAEKLEGVAEKLAPEATTAPTLTPEPEPMATSAPSPTGVSEQAAPTPLTGSPEPVSLPTPIPPPTTGPTVGPLPTPTATEIAPTTAPIPTVTVTCDPRTLSNDEKIWPAVFAGTAKFDGSDVPDGTTVRACIDGVQVASVPVVRGGRYTLVIRNLRGESFEGKEVTFMIGDAIARETAIWEAGGAGIINLTATGTPGLTAVAPSPALIPASITVEPQSADPGQVVTISGTGFQPYTTVHQLAINPSGMDSISVLSYPTPSTNAAGEFTTDMLIFSLPNGDHEVAVTVAGTSTTATFTVTGSTYLSGIDYPAASINVEPVSAAAGAVVTITGSGFPPFGLVQQLRLGGINVLPVPQPHTDSAGNLGTQIMVPKLGLGNAQVEIVIAGTSANTPITIGSAIPASITVEPISAEPGQVVTITGTGFPPFTTIASFTLGSISVLPPFPIGTEASGEFTTDVLIPSLPNGVHVVVVAVGVTSTAATFIVTGSP